MKKCDSCGKLYQENKDVFCPHCGAVAQKQCTHISSFDSKRYDRGELYQNNNPQYQNTTYTQGVDPHVQREKYAYNKVEDTFGDASQYSDETPKVKSIFDFTKVKKSGNNKTKIGVIVSVCIIIFNLLAANIPSFDDVDDYSDYEIVSEIYAEAVDFYGVSSSASVSISSEDGMSKDIEISIDDIWLHYENNDSYELIQDSIKQDGVLTEINVCTFSETTVSENDYNTALAESYFLSSNYGDEPGHYQFTHEFDYNEIVHIIGGVSVYVDDEIYVNIALPFSAFSVNENGEITYYTSYADDSTEWNTIFTECSNEMTVSDYDVCIVLNDEE